MRLLSVLGGVVALSVFTMANAKPAAVKKAGSLAEGKKVFETNCIVCHGKEGKGDGAAAAALNPKPRNFNDAVYMQGRPIATLKKVITEGGQSVGLSPIMAGWQGTLTAPQIESVLKYVLTFSQPTKEKKAK